MSKIKEQLVLMVKVPGYQIATPVIIDYDSIWSTDESHWKFQTWLDWCKKYINVQGRFCKDGKMSLKNICVTTSNLAETFYYYPSQCQPIVNTWIDSYK